MKRFVALFLVMVTVLLCPFSALADAKDTYAQAQELLAKNQYSEAAKLFESVGGYEDAAMLAMYCKACAFCESGYYDTGIVSFEALGNFKDSPMRIAYYTARRLEAKAGTNDWITMEAAQKLYMKIPVYLDCFDRITALDKRMEEAKKAQYDTAVAFMNKGEYASAIAAFKKIKTYSDSAEKIKVCETAIIDGKYDDAVALKNAGKYEEAIKAFTEIRTHKDSADQITECRYEMAVALKNTGKYEEAIEVFLEINTYKDSNTQIEMCRTARRDKDYDAAVALMNEGKFDEAIRAFKKIKTHRDSEAQIEACRVAIAEREYANKQAEWANVSVGDYITLGTYEQDGNQTNGKEDIEWLVISKSEDRMLVLSRHILDSKVYHIYSNNFTWETCSLRKWLNSDFINTAFSDGEKALILPTVIPADDEFSNATVDKVFLLSSDEAKLLSIDDRKAEFTRATKNQKDVKGFYYWLLRSFDYETDPVVSVIIFIDCVELNGDITDSGGVFPTNKTGVRPAIMLNLKPLE